MKDFKVRGKKLDDGAWVSGIGTIVDGDKMAQVHVPATGEEKTGVWMSVDPETVGLFTQLEDKKTNDVFENDIVVFSPLCYSEGYSKKIGVVKYGPGKIYFETLAGETYFYENVKENKKIKDLEVIGNIFDNSELLSLDY